MAHKCTPDLLPPANEVLRKWQCFQRCLSVHKGSGVMKGRGCHEEGCHGGGCHEGGYMKGSVVKGSGVLWRAVLWRGALKSPPPLFWSTSRRYVSCWNAFLSDRILTTKAFHYEPCTLAVNKGIVGVGNILHFKGENWFCPCFAKLELTSRCYSIICCDLF